CERAARNRHSAVEPLDNPGWRKYREAVRVSERGPRRTNLFDKREMKLDRNRSSGTGGSELRITHRVLDVLQECCLEPPPTLTSDVTAWTLPPAPTRIAEADAEIRAISAKRGYRRQVKPVNPGHVARIGAFLGSSGAGQGTAHRE